MISARALWRIFVMPLYVMLAGVVFSLAMTRTAGSIIGGLAPLAPWALLAAAVLAALLVVGSILRVRRRLRHMRRSIRRSRRRVARRADAWTAPEADWAEHGHR
ncbi:hypothetical protein [Luteimonas deserti]|uniref:Uncharacterized protein n=1 Tax=Luteimonas deserti TaxID=2752306 RepID=A0A7Z0QV79_9GAMM|nr:hypothetical protein [Luteimonas deserti]NYZ63978.1 hypothetical protein [Luteimonas deserti]